MPQTVSVKGKTGKVYDFQLPDGEDLGAFQAKITRFMADRGETNAPAPRPAPMTGTLGGGTSPVRPFVDAQVPGFNPPARPAPVNYAGSVMDSLAGNRPAVRAPVQNKGPQTKIPTFGSELAKMKRDQPAINAAEKRRKEAKRVTIGPNRNPNAPKFGSTEIDDMALRAMPDAEFDKEVTRRKRVYEANPRNTYQREEYIRAFKAQQERGGIGGMLNPFKMAEDVRITAESALTRDDVEGADRLKALGQTALNIGAFDSIVSGLAGKVAKASLARFRSFAKSGNVDAIHREIARLAPAERVVAKKAFTGTLNPEAGAALKGVRDIQKGPSSVPPVDRGAATSPGSNPWAASIVKTSERSPEGVQRINVVNENGRIVGSRYPEVNGTRAFRTSSIEAGPGVIGGPTTRRQGFGSALLADLIDNEVGVGGTYAAWAPSPPVMALINRFKRLGILENSPLSTKINGFAEHGRTGSNFEYIVKRHAKEALEEVGYHPPLTTGGFTPKEAKYYAPGETPSLKGMTNPKPPEKLPLQATEPKPITESVKQTPAPSPNAADVPSVQKEPWEMTREEAESTFEFHAGPAGQDVLKASPEYGELFTANTPKGALQFAGFTGLRSGRTRNAFYFVRKSDLASFQSEAAAGTVAHAEGGRAYRGASAKPAVEIPVNGTPNAPGYDKYGNLVDPYEAMRAKYPDLKPPEKIPLKATEPKTSTPPKVEAVPKPEPQAVTGLANQQQARQVAAGIIDEIESAGGKGAKHWQEVGKGRGNEADKLAAEIAAGNKAIDGEAGGILLEGDRLKAQAVNDASKALNDAIKSGDQYKVTAARTIYEAAKTDRADFLELVQQGKGKWSDFGRALQAGSTLDEGNWADVIQRMENAKGRVLTEKETTALQNLVTQLDAGNVEGVPAKIKAIQDELARVQAESALKGAPRTRTARFDVKSLDKELEGLTKQIRELSSVAGALPDPRLFVLYGKVAWNYGARGINTLDEIVAKTIAHFKNLGHEVSEQDVIDAMAGPHAEKRTRSEMQQELARLKLEAKRQSTMGKEAAKTKAAEAKAKATAKMDAAAEKAQAKGVADLDKEAAKLDAAAERQQAKPFQRESDVQGRIKRLEEELRTGNYRVPTKREGALTKQMDLLLNKESNLRRIVRGKVGDAALTSTQRATRELGALPRTLKATLDASATLRQGFILAMGHPVTAAKAFGKASRAAFDPAYAGRLEREMLAHPMESVRLKAKLYRATKDVATNGREESFMSGWAEKIPIYGKLVAGSERHYNTFLNVLRTEVFDTAAIAGNVSDEGAKALADFINVATGRGRLGKDLQQSGEALAKAFFAPRFALSRIQAPADALGLTGAGRAMWRDPVAQKELVRSWLGTLGAAGTVTALAKAGGADVELSDTDNPDWMKIKVGNTRFDYLAGMQQPARLVTNIVRTALGTRDAKQNILADVTRFLMYKVSPAVEAPATFISGKNVIGQDQGKLETLVRTVAPLVAQDIWEITHDPKTPEEVKIAAALGAFLGVGVQTYQSKKAKYGSGSGYKPH